jgi:FkbM family methyltransferase
MNMMNFFRSLFNRKTEFQTDKQELSIDKQELSKYLPENPIIVEAGMFDAADTEDFARVFSGGHIHGFECLPYYYDLSCKRLSKYTNVSTYPVALSDAAGELDFYVSTFKGELSASGSLLAPKLHQEVHPDVKFNERIKVKAVTLDDWAAEHGILKVDFLWLDLQGAEIRALQGAEKMLQNVTGIFTEVSLIETYENVPLYDEVKSFLQSKGFRIVKEYLPYKDMGNVFFLK